MGYETVTVRARQSGKESPLFGSLSGGGQPQGGNHKRGNHKGCPYLRVGVQEELLLGIGTVGYLNLRQHQGVTQEGADFVAQW